MPASHNLTSLHELLVNLKGQSLKMANIVWLQAGRLHRLRKSRLLLQNESSSYSLKQPRAHLTGEHLSHRPTKVLIRHEQVEIRLVIVSVLHATAKEVRE